MKESQTNEVVNPAGRKIVRDHMRKMLRIGEADESIKALNQSLRSLETLLKKKSATSPVSTSNKVKSSSNLRPR